MKSPRGLVQDVNTTLVGVYVVESIYIYTRNFQWWLSGQNLVSSFSSYSLGYLDGWGTGDLVAMIPAWRSQFQCSDLFVCLGVSHSSLTPHGITVDGTRINLREATSVAWFQATSDYQEVKVSPHPAATWWGVIEFAHRDKAVQCVVCDICVCRQPRKRRQWRWPASGWSSLYGSLLKQKLFTKPGINYTMSSNFIQ